jgi:hypothetical protein
MITGERYAGKLARTVREGAVGKGPAPRAPRRQPTSLEAAGAGNGASHATAPVPDPTPTRLTDVERARDRYLIRGVLSTAIKHTVNPLTVLRDAFTGRTWLPPAALTPA